MVLCKMCLQKTVKFFVLKGKMVKFFASTGIIGKLFAFKDHTVRLGQYA